jgi:hypothetical protein
MLDNVTAHFLENLSKLISDEQLYTKEAPSISLISYVTNQLVTHDIIISMYTHINDVILFLII